MRLLYVTPRYLPYVGGTEIHTAELATRLAAVGHDVTVLATEPAGTATRVEQLAPVDPPVGGAVPIVGPARGVRVVRVPAWPRGGDLYVAPALCGWIAGRRWDLVHCQGYHTFVAPLAMATAVRHDLPFVVTFHSGGHTSALRRGLRPLQQHALQPLLARAERLIGVSAFETARFERALRLPADRFVTVPNGSSLPPAGPVLPASVAAAAGAADRRVICSVGRVEKYKGHHRIVAALPELRRRVPGIELWIVGDGPFRPSVERLAARLGVAGAVRFCPVPPDDRAGMAATLQQAELVVSLSAYESQGVAVYEALALGRPVLAADATALHEVVGRGQVRAVPPRCTSGELASAIRRCLAEPLVPDPVSLPRWDEMAARLDALYHELVPTGQPTEVPVGEPVGAAARAGFTGWSACAS